MTRIFRAFLLTIGKREGCESMKVLVLTDRMDVGGAETHIVRLVEGLIALGARVTLLSGGGRLAEHLKAAGVEALTAPLGTHNPIRLLCLRVRLSRYVRKEHFDILHAHARVPAWLIRGMRRHGIAEIVTVHAHFRIDPLRASLSYWGERTLAVSEDLRRYVCDRYGVPAERVTVIPNGMDCVRFCGYPRDEKEDFFVVFASRLDGDCSLGAELLCRIAPVLAERYPSLRIAIAGGGEARERILTLAEAANRAIGSTVIESLGWVEDMPTLLRRADVFVGVSRAAMEAAACGCAVILCGNEGYLGILDECTVTEAALSNFCARGAPQANAERLLGDLTALLDASDLRLALGKWGRRMIVEHYSDERMCRETLALYEQSLHTRARVTVVIGGYFGCGNTGDDALLLGVLGTLRRIAPEVRVILLGGRPARDRRRFGVACVGRKNPFTVLGALRRADLFLLCGGSLLQDLTGSGSLLYYLGLLRLARLMRVRTAMVAAGIGPLLGAHAGARVRAELNRCRYISLRDADSERFLRALGVDEGILHSSADPALLLPMPPRERAEAILCEHGLSPTDRFLCVALRGGRSYAVTRAILLAAVRIVCQRHGLRPLFPVFDEQYDRADSGQAARQLDGVLLSLREPSDALAILSRCEAAVGMRLHALILATSAGTPALGIPADPRDPKIVSFAKEAGQLSVSVPYPSAAEIVERIEELLTCGASMRPILADSAAQMRKKAEKDLENMRKMLYNSSKEDLPEERYPRRGG